MLPRQNLGRRHQSALPSSFNSSRQRHECHQRLARTDIPLQQAVHAHRAFHIREDFRNSTGLGPGWAIGQSGADLPLQLTTAFRGAAWTGPGLGAHQGKGQLMRKKLIIGEALTHAKAVLFINHRKTKIRKGNVLLKKRMGADENIDLTACERL